MFLQNKEKLTQSKMTNSSSRIKQNYVPFISKCTRFQPTKEKVPKLPNIKIDQMIQQSIHRQSRSKQKDKNQNPTQFFFKSDIQRFNNSQLVQVPSPVHYHIEQASKSKESITKISPKKILPIIKTIPAIPDNRNKYGYNFEGKSNSLVNKTPQQLQRERFLMKQYQDSLINEKTINKKLKESNSLLLFKQIEKKVSKLFNEGIEQVDKQNKVQHNASLCQFRKPKISHMYEYHPINMKQKDIIIPSITEKDHKVDQIKPKYQFFNSSERRFKTVEAESPIVKQKLGVRDYLSKMLNQTNLI